MNRGKWSTDVGYDEDSQDGFEDDLLEDIERLLERKLNELFSKLQNLKTQAQQLPTNTSTSTIPDLTSPQVFLKELEIMKESETKSCQETTK